MSLLSIFALYLCISFSVKMAQGLTIFGDSNQYNNTLETSGPTMGDISVLILYWILTISVLGIDIYFIFFKKTDDKKYPRKEIVDGKTVIIKEDDKK